MTNGTIEIVPEESTLVQNIFRSYLAGESLQQLANSAERTGLHFRENAEHWNKSMISRILDDKCYWNGDKFPMIISKELAKKASSNRQLNFYKNKCLVHNMNVAWLGIVEIHLEFFGNAKTAVLKLVQFPTTNCYVLSQKN